MFFFFLFFLSFMLFTLAGRFLFHSINASFYHSGNFFGRLFYDLVLGLSTVTIVYAIFRTSGKTILLLAFMPLLILISNNRAKQKWQFFNFRHREILHDFQNIKIFAQAIPLLLALAIVYLAQIYFFYSFSEHTYIIPHEDLFFYSRVSASIGYWGKENLLYAFNGCIAPVKNGISLYHFFDLWLNAALSNLYKVGSYQSLYFITYPFLSSVLLIGVLSLWERVASVNFLKILASVGFLLLGAVYYPFYGKFQYMKNTIPLLTDTTCFSLFGRKLIIVGILSIAVLHSFIDKKVERGIVILLVMPLMYTSGTLFGIFGAVIIFLIYQFIFKFENVSRSFLFYVTLYMIIVLAFFSLNKISNFSDGFLKGSLLNSEGLSDFVHNIRGASSVAAYYVLFFCMGYGVYSFLYFLISNNFSVLNFSYFKKFFFILLTSLLVGMFFLFVFFKNLDGRQFFTNLMPLLNMALVFCVINFIENANSLGYKKWFGFAGLLIASIFLFKNVYDSQVYNSLYSSRYSRSFTNQITEELTNYPKSATVAYRLATVKEPYFYERPLFNSWSFLDFNGFYNVVNNSTIDFSIYQNGGYQNSCLGSFLSLNRDTTNYQIQFVREKNIKIIVAQDIQQNIPKSMTRKVLSDSLSGEFVYFLK